MHSRDISNKLKRILDIARSTALMSQGVGPGRQQMSAILFDKKVIHARFNQYKTHRFLSNMTNFPCLHAETSCILSYGLHRCKGLQIMICRVMKDGSFGLAYPCETCIDVIQRSGIKRIWYTDENSSLSFFDRKSLT